MGKSDSPMFYVVILHPQKWGRKHQQIKKSPFLYTRLCLLCIIFHGGKLLHRAVSRDLQTLMFSVLLLIYKTGGSERDVSPDLNYLTLRHKVS